MRNGYTVNDIWWRRKPAPERGGNHDEPGHTEKSDSIDSRFSVELCNRLAALEVEENINKDCIQMAKVYTETAEKVLG